MLNILINTREKKWSLSLKEKALFLSLLTLVFVALLIPVMQASKNRQLGVYLRGVERQRQLLDEERQVILSLLAEASLPEVILEKASNENLVLEKILGENIKVVTVKE